MAETLHTELTLEKLTQIVKKETNLNMDGFAMKHISGKYGTIATEGITGPDGKEMLPEGGMICVKDREREVLYEYGSRGEMIDDGWVVD
ncbi:MAG: hypothetical protein JXN62_01730 [Bacteroidales bacterium]|nr:hypothetical protein [Bacteroidales bacterium]